ncbi:MAG: biotin--[acetyl-CoA-carboxylase] ligase, partial [Cyclobacteriaceae bacterium]
MHKILANTLFLGKDIFYLTECHSSNEVAMSLYRSNLSKEGTIVRCLHQLDGKGQRGNKWFTEAGLNLTFSMVFTPVFLEVYQQFVLNMAVSNGIFDALSKRESQIKVKWPNDIVHPKGKLGGILIENVVGLNGFELAIVGLGLNINQTKFSVPNALSLANLKEE